MYGLIILGVIVLGGIIALLISNKEDKPKTTKHKLYRGGDEEVSTGNDETLTE